MAYPTRGSSVISYQLEERTALTPCFQLLSVLLIAASAHAVCDKSISMRDLKADVILGGLFPVHYYTPHSDQYILNAYALTWIEAFHHSINLINDNQTLLPGVKLGYDVRDSCNDERYALQHALDFTLDSSYFVPAPMSNEYGFCNCFNNGTNRLVAVVGGASSSVSIGISHLLSVHYTPQISYSSTSVTLSDKNLYRSFLRTVPPDINQAQAIADFVHFFNWTFVDLLASDDDYGRLGSDELRKELNARGICRAVDRTFPANITVAEAQRVVAEIQQYESKARVVILWCEIGSAVTILAEAANAGLFGLSWMGTESWGNNVGLFALDPRIIDGIIGIKPAVFEVANFESHLATIAHNSTYHNPWLSMYWNEVFKCNGKYENGSRQLVYEMKDATNQQIKVICPDGTEAKAQLPLNKYPNVISAVYAIAYGLHEALNCSSKQCEKTVGSLHGRQLLSMIKNTSFNLPNSTMKLNFDENGDLMYASYTFTNLVADAPNSLPVFIEVGTWEKNQRHLQLSVQKMHWGAGRGNPPYSRCSSPCRPGQYKIGGREPCCWECVNCQPNHVSSSDSARFCTPCTTLTIANANQTACIRLEPQTLKFKSPLGSSILALITGGLVLTLFVATVLFSFWETPVVKSSNRELSLLQIGCIFLIFCLPFIGFFPATALLCVVRISCFATLYTVVLAVVFTKTYRLLLIFRKFTTEESKLLRNSYQSLVVLSLVALQMVILFAWHLFYSPQVYLQINRPSKTVLLHCGTQEDVLFFITMGPLFFLMLCSAYMAFKARKLPEGFNEARNISFAMFISFILWFAYIPVYFSLTRSAHHFLYSINYILSNTVILTLLYGSKIRIMLFYPELNTTAQYRRNTAHSTLQAVLRRQNDGRPPSSTVTLGQMGRTPTVESICSNTKLSPSLNRRFGVQDRDMSASSVILATPSKS